MNPYIRKTSHAYTVRVQYESLKDALETIKPVIARKPTLPILNNVAIVAKGSTMTITGSDLQKSQIVTIPAYIYEPIAITLPYRTLYDVIALASPEPIHFSVDNQTHTATISQASYAWKCNIKGIAIEEYPHIATNESATLLAMVDYEQLKAMARLAVKSASNEDSRPILTCARIDIEPGKVTIATANGYQLFESSLLAETESTDSTYTAYIPAKSLYDLLAKMKDKPATIEIYGTAIDNGRVNGSLFLNDSQLQAYDSGDFKPELIKPGDNATIHTVQPALLESLSDTIWQNKKAELITIKGKDWNFAFIEYEKKSRSRSAKLTIKNKAKKIESLPFTISGYGFEIGNVTELADFMRYVVKNTNYGDNTLFITKFGGFVEFRWQDMRLVINASHPGKWLKAEHTKEQYADKSETVKQLGQAENIAANHIEFKNHGLEYSQGKIFVYRLIDNQKVYMKTLFNYGKISELWHKIRKDYTSELIPRASITRHPYKNMKDFADKRVNEIYNATRTMIRYFEQLKSIATLPELTESPDYETMLADENETIDYSDLWQYIDITAIETESIVESATMQAIEEHEAQNNSTDYEIEIYNADNEDMLLIALELADNGIRGDDRDGIGCYLRHNRPCSVFVEPIEAGRTVEMINGLGFQTDENTPEPSPDNDESPQQRDSPSEAKNRPDEKIITPDLSFFQQAPEANNTKSLQDAFKSIGFDPSTIYGIFEYVDIAEDFIEKTIREHPDRAPDIWDTFKLLQPSTKMMKMHHKLYDHHIRELMQRVLNGDDLKPATRAEILVGMSEVASVIPIHNCGAYLFSRLFKQIFGDNHPTVKAIDTVSLNEPYKGAADEMESELRHKLRNEDRPKPDVNRWHESVCDEKKEAILGKKWRKYA